MKRVLSTAMMAAVLGLGAASASPLDADLWIGLPEAGDNGFLLDEDTGDAWMTGECLKTLSRAERSGSVWTSRTVEQVSVGRGFAVLDQTFRLDVSEAAPEIRVSSRGRPEQGFAAQLITDCDATARCRALASVPAC